MNAPLFQYSQYQLQDGSDPKPNPFNGIITHLLGRILIGNVTGPFFFMGNFNPHLRTQYSVQYNLNLQREIARDLVFQIGYVGSQGHRLLASHDVNFEMRRLALDLQAVSDSDRSTSRPRVRPVLCGQFVLHSRRDGATD